jgi:hypothetical protein
MISDLGYFGNIWVRQNNLLYAGNSIEGHEHYFDHVTLLARGKIKVEVAGQEPKEFTAPTFIVMRKELSHKMTALEHNTIYYCVFALRDVNGEVVGDIYGAEHDPLPHSAADVEDGYWEKRKKIEHI